MVSGGLTLLKHDRWLGEVRVNNDLGAFPHKIFDVVPFVVMLLVRANGDAGDPAWRV